jgi:phosphoglycolate phosphatase-like HAD superfamily hydrolase
VNDEQKAVIGEQDWRGDAQTWAKHLDKVDGTLAELLRRYERALAEALDALEQARAENQQLKERSLWNDLNSAEREASGLRERVARLEGVIEGLAEAAGDRNWPRVTDRLRGFYKSEARAVVSTGEDTE